MLFLGLVNEFHTDDRKKRALISKLVNELPRSKRNSIYLLLESKNISAVIKRAVDEYELEPIDGN